MMSKPQTALIQKAIRGEITSKTKLKPAEFGLLLKAYKGRIRVFENIPLKHLKVLKGLKK